MIHLTLLGQPPSKSNEYVGLILPSLTGEGSGTHRCPTCRMLFNPKIQCGTCGNTKAIARPVPKGKVKDYERGMIKDIPKSARGMMLDRPVIVSLDAYLERDSQDLDNVPKAVLDGLQRPESKGGAAVLADDKHVRELHCRKFIDPVNPRVELSMMDWQDPDQGDLFGGGLSMSEAVAYARTVLPPNVWAQVGQRLEEEF